jgi:hypothetical protein
MPFYRRAQQCIYGAYKERREVIYISQRKKAEEEIIEHQGGEP